MLPPVSKNIVAGKGSVGRKRSDYIKKKKNIWIAYSGIELLSVAGTLVHDKIYRQL